jgi:5-methylcytosine-specific restriction enzyme A
LEKLPFIPNQIYRRSDIHDQYGGNRQSGISPSANLPYIFIFSGKSGAQYGYKDGWDNPKVFSYTGEGQIGDMQFVKGNLALKEHIKNGKRVFLFEYQRTAYVKFISELEFYDADYFETMDINNNNRIGIRFFFTRKGIQLPIAIEQLNTPTIEEASFNYNEIRRPNKTERSGLIISRVGQGAYRKSIIHRWEYQCAVTSFNKLELLIASHILPWATASDDERLDVHNGILLSPTYDALFDRHLISFENNGKIILSDKIDSNAYQKIGVTGKEHIKDFSQYNFRYLDKHRSMFISQGSI